MSDATVLIIAGSDSSGGAGLVRDVSVARDLGVGVRVAITAVTAQTDTQVRQVHPVPTDVLRAQIECALDGARPAAVKIGMLADATGVETVADALQDLSIPIILDPVLCASSGRSLLATEAVEVLTQRLLPCVNLITPNLPELAVLSGSSVCDDVESGLEQGEALRALGVWAVLIKGGHGSGAVATDILLDETGVQRMHTPRLQQGRRGTGCTLATAIACHVALGASLRSACDAAKQYTHRWIAESQP